MHAALKTANLNDWGQYATIPVAVAARGPEKPLIIAIAVLARYPNARAIKVSSVRLNWPALRASPVQAAA
jgi:hypothetical protein